MKRGLLNLVIGILAITQIVWAAEPFKIQTIQVTGLRGISQDAVLGQLPIKAGDWFQLSDSEGVIKQLYSTGFFDDVQLSQAGQKLIVRLKERPIICQIKIEGQHGLPQEAFDKLLKDLGLMSGEFFNKAALEQLKTQFLSGAYPQLGQHAAQVDTQVIHHNNSSQVDIQLKFEPGPILRFAGIHFLGNRIMTNSQLQAALPIHTNRIWAFLTNRTTYFNDMTKQQSLDAIRSFYKDRGYADIAITSERMSITPDRSAAYWTIKVSEGAQYTVGQYRIIGAHPLTETEQLSLIHFTMGDVYSQKQLTQTKKAITDCLKDQGYLFAKVTITPTVHTDTKRVDLIVQINPGKKTYVRHINILGNYYIQDKVIRRLFQQQEASLSSRAALEASEQRLNRSGFMKSPAVLMPVPVLNGSDDQVDIQFQIDESVSKLNAGFSLGCSSVSSFKEFWNGFTIDTTARVENIFGTGKTVDFTLKKSQYDDFIGSVDYDNPYFNLDGVQSYFRFYLAKTSGLSRTIGEVFDAKGSSTPKDDKKESKPDPLTITPGDEVASNEKRKELLRSQYETGVIGLQTTWGFPIDAKGNLWRVTLEGKSISLYLLPQDEDKQATELKDFTNQYGNNLWQMLLTTGFYHNQLEGFLFPYKGTQHNFNVVGAYSLAKDWKPYHYFKVNYRGAIFYPVWKTTTNQEWSAGLRWNFGYGNTLFTKKKGLPFFDNYHSGRLRGYENDSLGPKDSRENMLGANLLVSGSMMVCFPQPISGHRHRVSFFVDTGNLYHVDHLQSLWEKHYDPLKLSAGVAVDFVVPVPVMFGGNLPVNVSLGMPIKPNLDKKTGDRVSNFQFSLGFSFVEQF